MGWSIPQVKVKVEDDFPCIRPGGDWVTALQLAPGLKPGNYVPAHFKVRPALQVHKQLPGL